MKVLDADELHSGINNTLNGLKHLRNQLETLEMSILSISSLESELRGEGGNSIRAFYKDVHLPFLHSMKQMVEQYEATLKELTQSLRSLDSSSRAMIRQSFIQQDLTQGIRRTENITSDLTGEGNRTIQSVDDIVSLPRLDDHRVHQHAQSANNQMTQTIERLHHFDQQQTNKLEATAQDLSRLKSTISEIQTLFQNGTLSLLTYQPNQLARLLNDPVIGGMSLSQTYGPMALGMMPTYAPFSSMNFAFSGQPIKDVEKNQSTLGWISTGLDFVPVLSNLKAGIEAATGTDFITGREIGNLERAALVAAIFGGPLVKGGIKVVKWGSKLFSKVKNVLNPQKVKTVVDGIFSKVTQGFHALRNTAAELTKKIGEIRIPLPMQNQYALANGMFGGTSRTVGEIASDVKDTLVRMSGSVSKGTGKVYPTRQIDSVAEAHLIDRVKDLRGNLTSRYKKSGNFAVAEVEVSGLSKSEFYAQSSINDIKGSLAHKVPEISLQPKNPMFKASEAFGKDGESYLRNTDTEYKILNDIASRLADNTQATGKIKLFTELDTCDSCSKVIAEFAAKYKNIELEVIHNNGNRIIP